MSLFHRCKSCNNLPHPVKTCCHIWSFRNGTKNLNGTKDHKWLAWPISSKLANLRKKDTPPKWHEIAQKVTSPKWKTVGAYHTHKNLIQAKIHKVMPTLLTRALEGPVAISGRLVPFPQQGWPAPGVSFFLSPLNQMYCEMNTNSCVNINRRLQSF